MPDVDCKSSPRGVLGRPHTGLVCGLPASLRDPTFAASGTPGISLEALRHKPVAHGPHGGLDPVFDAELPENARDVVLDRGRAYIELSGDLPVALARDHELQHLALTLGQLEPRPGALFEAL